MKKNNPLEARNNRDNQQEKDSDSKTLREKSISPYLNLHILSSIEKTPFSSTEQTKGLELIKSSLAEILKDKEVLRKLYSAGERPTATINSPEYKEYLEQFLWLGEKYGINVSQFERLPASVFFGPYDEVKDRSIIDILKNIHEAYYATEKMIAIESEARNYMSQNSAEIKELVEPLKVTYSHPDHYNFSVHRISEGNYTILLDPKDFDFTSDSEQPNLQDKLKLAHEMYHAIFDQLVMPESVKNITFEVGTENSFSAMTEGFATIMEMHLNKDMQDNFDLYELTEDDVGDLKSIQNQRLSYLKNRLKENKHLHYWEGVSRIFHNIINQDGVNGVINFCKQLDFEKIIATRRDDLKYIELINKNDPEAWIEYFGKSS